MKSKKIYNPNDNWIKEYKDKHGTLPTVKIPLSFIYQGERKHVDAEWSPYGEKKWEDLKKSIKKNGLQEKIRVYEEIRGNRLSYFIKGGRHRTCVLYELKGPDYIVEVVIVERRTFISENHMKLKTINPINIHKTSSPEINNKVHDNLQKQIERKLADIKSKSVNSEKPYNFNKVNKTYKDYL